MGVGVTPQTGYLTGHQMDYLGMKPDRYCPWGRLGPKRPGIGSRWGKQEACQILPDTRFEVARGVALGFQLIINPLLKPAA